MASFGVDFGPFLAENGLKMAKKGPKLGFFCY
jgi:hypothetical protein